MMNSNGKRKIWFRIEEFKSQLVSDIKPCKDGSFDIFIRHPNTKEVLESKKVMPSEIKDQKDPWNELAQIAAGMKSLIKVDTLIQAPVKRSAAPKKGKMDPKGIL